LEKRVRGDSAIQALEQLLDWYDQLTQQGKIKFANPLTLEG
jgi:hypothetical protein